MKSNNFRQIARVSRPVMTRAQDSQMDEMGLGKNDFSKSTWSPFCFPLLMVSVSSSLASLPSSPTILLPLLHSSFSSSSSSSSSLPPRGCGWGIELGFWIYMDDFFFSPLLFSFLFIFVLFLILFGGRWRVVGFWCVWCRLARKGPVSHKSSLQHIIEKEMPPYCSSCSDGTGAPTTMARNSRPALTVSCGQWVPEWSTHRENERAKKKRRKARKNKKRDRETERIFLRWCSGPVVALVALWCRWYCHVLQHSFVMLCQSVRMYRVELLHRKLSRFSENEIK